MLARQVHDGGSEAARPHLIPAIAQGVRQELRDLGSVVDQQNTGHIGYRIWDFGIADRATIPDSEIRNPQSEMSGFQTLLLACRGLEVEDPRATAGGVVTAA